MKSTSWLPGACMRVLKIKLYIYFNNCLLRNNMHTKKLVNSWHLLYFLSLCSLLNALENCLLTSSLLSCRESQCLMLCWYFLWSWFRFSTIPILKLPSSHIGSWQLPEEMSSLSSSSKPDYSLMLSKYILNAKSFSLSKVLCFPIL